MAGIKHLPPMPPSDVDSLQRNRFDGFYKVMARDFWGENEINHIELPEDKKCEHEFYHRGHEAVCKNCNIGFIGPIEIREGKLFHKGEPIGI